MKTGMPSAPAPYKIDLEQVSVATDLANQALVFVVAHEIGHILLELNPQTILRSDIPKSQAVEYGADSYAVSMILGATQRPGMPPARFSRRMAYAGAEFALRVFAGLEHVGFRFAQSHPAGDNRLTTIRDIARKLCGSEEAFRQISTIASAFDELLESMEMGLLGCDPDKPIPTILTADRILYKLAVILEQWGRGIVDRDFAAKEANLVLKDAPEPLIREAAIKIVKTPEWITPAQQSLFQDLRTRLNEPGNSILAKILVSRQ
jgi:hypothetical protein